VLSPTAILGYGFPAESFREGMRRRPHVIAVDGGSTDPGPYYLGSGKSFTDRGGVKRDMEFMLTAAAEAGIPVIVGTAGGSGADSHLDWNVEIVKEIAREQGLSFRLAVISAQIDKAAVLADLAAGKLRPMGAVPLPSAGGIADSSNIVAQMGAEPIIAALDAGADVVITGRAYDPVVFAALAIREGFDPGPAMHMGKILECAAIAASPGSGSDCMFGYLREGHFEMAALSDARQCTTISVAAHTLYEKSDPTVLPGPGGVLDLKACTFEQTAENTVIVRGSRYIKDSDYFIKLEGARMIGYRTISFAACADPIMIGQIDEIVAAVKSRVAANFENIDNFFLDFKIYGAGGASLYGVSGKTPDEIGIIIESVAQSPADADTICSFARSSLLHYGYPGRISTAGNLAFPFSPSDFRAGEVYEFSVYCLMPSPDPCQYFPMTLYTCEKGVLTNA